MSKGNRPIRATSHLAKDGRTNRGVQAEPGERSRDDNVAPSGDDIQVYDVASESIEQIRIDLEKLGIAQSTVFPGLDGISAELAAKSWE